MCRTAHTEEGISTSTLVGRGDVSRDLTERYRRNEACRSGPGWTSGPDAQLIAIAQPFMEELSALCGESTMLGVLMRDGRLKIIASSVGTHAISYDARLSGGLRSYCSALGRVLLAHCSADFVDRYLAYDRLIKLTAYTVVDRLDLRERIDDARQEGYAISDREMDVAGSGVAAPIFGTNRDVIASLDIAVMSERLKADRQKFIQLVRRFAIIMSERNGYVASWAGM